jgi:hypothetical protein
MDIRESIIASLEEFQSDSPGAAWYDQFNTDDLQTMLDDIISHQI